MKLTEQSDPSLEEIKAHNAELRESVGTQIRHIKKNLQFSKNAEALQSAKLAKLHTENEDLKAQLAAATQAPEDPPTVHACTVLLQLIARVAVGSPSRSVAAAKEAVDNIQRHVGAQAAKIVALEQGVKSLQELVRELAAVRQADKEELQAKLEAAETEVARLSDVALDGYHALEKERENSARIKRESDAVRDENQKLRTLIRDWIAADYEGNTHDILSAEEALRKAVE